jgi:hypothetical protein
VKSFALRHSQTLSRTVASIRWKLGVVCWCVSRVIILFDSVEEARRSFDGEYDGSKDRKMSFGVEV